MSRDIVGNRLLGFIEYLRNSGENSRLGIIADYLLLGIFLEESAELIFLCRCREYRLAILVRQLKNNIVCIYCIVFRELISGDFLLFANGVYALYADFIAICFDLLERFVDITGFCR